MECPKCKGMMMLERFSDFFSFSTPGNASSTSWRHHQADHFGEPQEEPRRPRRSTGGDTLIRLT